MSLSARAIALAANTPCPRLDTLAAAGHSDTATATYLGYENKSPRLAYAVGIAFENRTTADKDALAELLHADPGACVVIDAEHGDSTLYERTLHLIADPGTSIILQGCIPGPLGGWLRPDILYKRAGQWETGEIKVYLDKDTETNPHSLGQAITQAAITTRALALAGVPTSPLVTIILSHLTGAPTARRLNCVGEIERIDALIERTQATGQAPTPEPFAPAGEHIYTIQCVGTCALAQYCKTQLQETGRTWPSNPLPALTGHTEQELRALVQENPLLQGAYQQAAVIKKGN